MTLIDLIFFWTFFVECVIILTIREAIPSAVSTLKLRVVSVVGNQSSLLQRELFCRSDLRIATFTRKISVDTPLVAWIFRSTSQLRRMLHLDCTS